MLAQTVESYVVLDNAAGTLTFKHDANKPAGAFSLNEGLILFGMMVIMMVMVMSITKTTLKKLSLMLLLPMHVPQIVTAGSLDVKI